MHFVQSRLAFVDDASFPTSSSTAAFVVLVGILIFIRSSESSVL